jgi:hypothetical protein
LPDAIPAASYRFPGGGFGRTLSATPGIENLAVKREQHLRTALRALRYSERAHQLPDTCSRGLGDFGQAMHSFWRDWQLHVIALA